MPLLRAVTLRLRRRTQNGFLSTLGYRRLVHMSAGKTNHVSTQVAGADAGCFRVSTPTRDVIRINDMKMLIPFSEGAQWPTKEPTVQPVWISLTMVHDLREAAQSDDVSHSLDYSEVLPTLVASSASEAFLSVEALSDRIFESCFARHPALVDLSLRISRPKALLHARSAGIESETTRAATHPARERLFIEDLECQTIVGVNPCEREEKQRVRFNISLSRVPRRDVSFDFRSVSRQILDCVQGSSYLTLEALTSLVTRTVLLFSGQETDSVTVRGAKPSALALADSAEVEMTRTLRDYQSTAIPSTIPCISPESAFASHTFTSLLSSVPDPFDHPVSFKHRAAIAIGANLGDRFANIELALRLLEAPGGDFTHGTGPPKAVVVDTSFMYETAPMYVTDQPKFINCACLIETDVEPRALLSFLKEIESTVGRVTSFRNGPRAIDLDILAYDSMVIDTRPETDRSTLEKLAGELLVPHPRIAEREFVLRPLDDMIPDYIHPTLGKSVRTLLTELVQTQPSDTPAMSKVMPWPRYPLVAHPQTPSHVLPVPPTATYWVFPVVAQAPRKTYIMGTLNATPDSFSDGSQHNSLPAALAYTVSSVAAGADIIDVGGYSTRPRAAYVSPEDELSRVVPVIEAVRALHGGNTEDPVAHSRAADVLISVDTFRWAVADAAVRAGANCINDVYAFSGPAFPPDRAAAEHFVRMRSVARELAVPVVLMHSRGEASANKDYSAYAYAADTNGRGAVVEGVRVELGERVDAAVRGRGGLRRWLVIVDPGLGFSKTVEGNLELLRDAAAVISDQPRTTAGSPLRRNPLAGFPQLIGTSRKSFLGKILKNPDPDGAYEGRETRPDERGWATAAAVSCAIQQQADIIRVHDVRQLGDVIRVASALWP